MKYLNLLGILLLTTIAGCNNNSKSNTSRKTDTVSTSIKTNTVTTKSTDNLKDKDDIRSLIRQMLKWSDSRKSVQLLPALEKDSICIGFDLEKLNKNLDTLRSTGFFADEFIDNYSQIIHTLDKKIKNNEFEKWNVYELPSFNFDNDVSPWCMCQDNLSWDKVEVEVIKLSDNKGDLKWYWGNLDPGTDPSWKDASYKFSVVKVDGKWEISYLQGFDYKESIK